MNVKYGGKQKTPRESKIPSDETEAAAYLGPYAAKLKSGDTQHYYFQVPPTRPSFGRCTSP